MRPPPATTPISAPAWTPRSSRSQYAIEQSVREQTNLNANILFNKTFGDWAFNGFIRGEYYNNFGQEQNMKTKEGLIVPNQYFIKNSKQTSEYDARI